MMETALVFDREGRTLHWHEPRGRSSGSLPDDRGLWEVLWENRAILGGVAHTHPWNGPTGPSGTDLTTFRAVELGLGKLLLWPLITFTHELYLVWNEERECYEKTDLFFVPVQGLEELRERSR